MNIRPIKGTTKVCLQHFSASAGLCNTGQSISQKAYLIRNAVCDLVDVKYDTGLRWFGKSIMPTGVNLIKLRYLLESLGYTLDENRSMLAPVRELSGQITLSLVSVKDVSQHVGINEHGVVRWFTEGIRPNKQRLDAIEALVDKHRANMQKKQEAWTKSLVELKVLSVLVRPLETADEKDHSAASGKGELLHDQVIDALGHLILAALPLAKMVLSDDYLPEEREQLRHNTRSARSNGVFDLSNMLNRLCGERARDEIKKP